MRRSRIGRATLCCLLLATVAGCRDADDPPTATDIVRPVKTLVVSAPDATAAIELPGQVRSAQRIDLAFKEVSGRIVELPISAMRTRWWTWPAPRTSAWRR